MTLVPAGELCSLKPSEKMDPAKDLTAESKRAPLRT